MSPSSDNNAAVLLVDPKFDYNVGDVLRTSALLGVSHLWWTGSRVPSPEDWPDGERLPRQERMRAYRRTKMHWAQDTSRVVDQASAEGLVPVCVEIVPGSVPLDAFLHPARALYVFGPEDGTVPPGIRRECHHFIQIPNAIPEDDPDSRTPFNLSQAVLSVLMHRLFQEREREAVK
jgi:tRNA(Leu) C34 or U34 (ribose-2'-O)-methylase TrmL